MNYSPKSSNANASLPNPTHLIFPLSSRNCKPFTFASSKGGTAHVFSSRMSHSTTRATFESRFSYDYLVPCTGFQLSLH